ncbi:hypothetical protein QBC38DRAFT_466074 [Podospora fimiseda]|uniref:Uncharacterized protein n=1 Tax=Podospora fimiseda TaxID=252190 RepID=A0AAN7BY11_9PEZI|nr:hypothetical protein QBC38DRAFT_466074 [Podospora fimiseda]
MWDVRLLVGGWRDRDESCLLVSLFFFRVVLSVLCFYEGFFVFLKCVRPFDGLFFFLILTTLLLYSFTGFG